MELGFQSSLKGHSPRLSEPSSRAGLPHITPLPSLSAVPSRRRRRGAAAGTDPAQSPVLNRSKQGGSAVWRSLCCLHAPGTIRLSRLYEWMNTNSMILSAGPRASPPPHHIHTSNPGSDFLFPLRGYLVWPFLPMSEVNYQKYEQNKPPLDWSAALDSGRPRTKTNRIY